MFFTKKLKMKLNKLSLLLDEQFQHNILVGEALCDLEEKIKGLEKRNQENEMIIEHLITITKSLDIRSYKDENQKEFAFPKTE